jgi:hypothetical protein
MLKKVIRFLLIYLALSSFAVVALFIDTWPHYPHGPLDWGLLFVIALPVTLLGEWLSDNALSSSLSLAVEARAKGHQLSWLRVSYYLALYILFAICAVAAYYWFDLSGV